MSRHEARINIIVNEHDVPVDVEYNFHRGRPATGPRYDCGGEPAEPDEYDITDIWVVTEKTREPAPAWLHSLLVNDDFFYEDLAGHHEAMEIDAEEYRADRRREMLAAE